MDLPVKEKLAFQPPAMSPTALNDYHICTTECKYCLVIDRKYPFEMISSCCPATPASPQHWAERLSDQGEGLCPTRASSAAGRRGNGTVEEGKLIGRRVHGDGDREIEDRVAVADGRAACLRGAGGRSQDLGLELEELPHEAEVGGDDAAALLDKLKGLV